MPSPYLTHTQTDIKTTSFLWSRKTTYIIYKTAPPLASPVQSHHAPHTPIKKMKFQIIIPRPTSASSSRLPSPKPQPLPTAAAAARPATIIAKRPRGRPPRKLRSNQEKLEAIARHLHAEYKWSLKDVIKHFVVDEQEREEGDTSSASAITTATTGTRTQQQHQQGRVGALIDAIWGQPEVLRELEAHPAFPQSLRKRRGTEEGDVSAGGSAEDDENEGEGDHSGSRSAEEDENEEGDEMSVESGREAIAEDENEGEMSVEVSAEDGNEGQMSLEASAEDENEREVLVASAEEENEGEMSMEASAEEENEGEISVEGSAEDENDGHLSVEASAEDENEAEAISGSTQDVVSAEEENLPTSGHSYSTQDEEEVPSPPSKFRMYIATNQTNIGHYREI